MIAIDISNYTDPLTPAALEAWKAAGVGLVIVQAIDPPAGFPAGRTRDQIQACLDAGLPVDAYVFLWFDLDVSDIQHKLSLLGGLPIRRLWLDVEDESAARYDQPTSEAKVRAALDACDGYSTTHGERPGVYSGGWYWRDGRYMGNTTAFSDRDLWDSNYDGVTDTISGFQSYGGWTERAIKQYQGSTSLAGINGVDMNVLSEQEASKLTAPTDPGTPVDQGWLDRKDEIVGLAGELKTVGDQIRAAANRKYGPIKADILPLADAVQSRANQILGG